MLLVCRVKGSLSAGQEIDRLIPLLTNSDLEAVRNELKVRLNES